MANATAAQAYTALRIIEEADHAADGMIKVVDKEVLAAAILAAEGTVLTLVEARVGIALAQGATDAATAASGEYRQNKAYGQMGVMVTPAADVLFAVGLNGVSSLQDEA